MLNRRNRLLTSEDFRTVLRRGKKVPVTGGLIAVLSVSDTEIVRCGVVVSKRVGNAVIRNSVKRRVRAACASVVAEYHGVSIVVRADEHAPGVSVVQWIANMTEAVAAVKKP